MDHAYLENRPPRWPWFLLVVMTLASFGGPFIIWWVVRGGESPDWPPDRFVEWLVFAGIVSLVATLFILSLGLALVRKRDLGGLMGSPPPARPAPSDRST